MKPRPPNVFPLFGYRYFPMPTSREFRVDNGVYQYSAVSEAH
jgi:hypothetical protein